jgi:hypothetical protein
MDYAEIYKEENWKKFPDCKIRIDDGDVCGENMWGKELPGGLVGLNNNPLTPGYKWQDIVRPGTDMPELVHRRWMFDVWYNFVLVDGEEGGDKDLAQRQLIMDTVIAAGGHPSFWVTGVGHSLCETSEVVAAVKEALLSLDMGFVFEEAVH